MSREIRFRAWDEKDSTMGEPFDFHEYAYEIDTYFGRPKIFLQWTGLKDKNGVEIYEGDIIQYKAYTVVVVYQAPSFVMKEKIKRGYSKQWHEFILPPEQNQFEEVAGNIYESPELLTPKE